MVFVKSVTSAGKALKKRVFQHEQETAPQPNLQRDAGIPILNGVHSKHADEDASLSLKEQALKPVRPDKDHGKGSTVAQRELSRSHSGVVAESARPVPQEGIEAEIERWHAEERLKQIKETVRRVGKLIDQGKLCL